MYERQDVRVRFNQDSFSEPLRVKSVGGRRWVVAVCAVVAVLELSIIEGHLDKANALKEEELKIKKEQVELARRQFMLDSIAVKENRKIR